MSGLQAKTDLQTATRSKASWLGGMALAATRLAKRWAVETTSAAALSVATFKGQAGGALSRAESLRQAQLALIDGRQGGGRWAHPFYWGAVVRGSCGVILRALSSSVGLKGGRGG